jgi:hypothetical protein
MFQACNGLSCGLTVVDTVPIIFTGFGQGPPAEKPSDTGSSPVEQHCVVPKVVGKTLAQARKAILAGHCVVGQVRLRKSATIPKGQIVAQAPRYNTVTTPGAAVTLVVSG